MRLRLPARGKRAYIAALVALLFAAIAGLAFGPVVRAKAEAAGRARGLEVKVGTVRPTWFGAVLEDVEVRPEGVSTVLVRISEVRAYVSMGLSPRTIEVHGGSVELSGPSAIDDILAWKQRRPKTDAPAPAHALPVTIDGLSAKWTGGEIDLDVQDMAVRRGDDGSHLEIAHASARTKDLTIDVRGGLIDLDAAGKISLARADSAELDVVLSDRTKAAQAAQTEPDPPAILVVKRPGKSAPQPYGPIVVLPDLHDWRSRVRAAVFALAGRTSDDVRVDLPAVSLFLSRGPDHVEIGPGSLSLSRSATDLLIDFSSRAAPGKSPLVLKVDAPIAAGDVIAELSGGPVTLALLGVKEGQMGLTDVERATIGGQGRITLTDAGDLLRFDAAVTLKDVSIRHDGIATDTVRGLALEMTSRGALSDKGVLDLDDAQLHMGSLHLRANGTAEQGQDHLAVKLSFELPTAACESLRTSLPTALLPLLERAHYEGTLGAKGMIAFDTRNLDALVLSYAFDDRCKLDVVPEQLDRDRLTHTFTYWAIDKDGKPIELESGPGSDRWTPLDEISPYMQTAVLTTEDGLFFKHKGFNHAAIRQSFIANLKAHKFVRGASTITMQLAKNLFLSREKTLARKLQEIVLADALEQTLTKDEIMELYLNVIEFGPDIYGIGAAAEHYFGRSPAELNLPECLLLSSLLPRPKESHKIWEKGEVPPSWVKHIHALMEIAAKSNKITPKELEEGEAEKIVFYKEGDPRPTPRRPLRAVRVVREAPLEDGDWVPAQ